MGAHPVGTAINVEIPWWRARLVRPPATFPDMNTITATAIPTRPAKQPAAKLWTAAVWAATVGAAGWAVARLAGVEPGGPGVQLMAFTQYAAAGSVVTLGLALLSRRWLAAAVAAAAAFALVATVLPRVIGAAADAGPTTLRVLTANLLFGGAPPADVLRLVREERVDVLALQEYTEQARDGLAAAGLAAELPYLVAYPEPGASGSALYSRYPLRDTGLLALPSGFQQARGVLDMPGAVPVDVVSVHPSAPAAWDRIADWRADFAAEPRAEPDGPVRLLIGDFNATLDHAPMRALIRSGYVDAADAAGAGLTPTWPYDERWYIPGVTIDHVLADRRVGIGAVRVHRIPGSDHRAVFAELHLPAA